MISKAGPNPKTTLTLSELRRPLKDKTAQEAMTRIDPDLELSDLATALFETDRGADDNAQFEFSHQNTDGFHSVTLASTRNLSNGSVVSKIQVSRSKSPDAAAPDWSVKLDYQPESVPTLNQMPDTLREAWNKSHYGSPTQVAEHLSERFGEIGDIEQVRIFHSTKVGEDSNYVGFQLDGNYDGVDTEATYLPWETQVKAVLTPEQLEQKADIPNSIAGVWDEWNLAPEALTEKMLDGTPLEVGQVELSLVSGHHQSAALGVQFVDRDNPDQVVGRADRKFYQEQSGSEMEQVAYHDLFRLAPEYQGQGVAKTFLRNSIGAYEELGIDRIPMMAAKTVGGYAWARYGWQLSDYAMENRQLEQQVEQRLEALKLDSETEEMVQNILDVDHPKKVWALSDLRQPVTKNGKETTLGKALLLGTHWKGTLYLDDGAARERLESCLGK